MILLLARVFFSRRDFLPHSCWITCDCQILCSLIFSVHLPSPVFCTLSVEAYPPKLVAA